MNERNVYIDWLKGFGIFMVVMGHCWMRSYSQYWVIYRFHMVLFMTLSGYLFNGKRDFKAFLFSKLKGLLIPYVCFSFVSIALSVLFLGGSLSKLPFYLQGILLGGKFCIRYFNFTIWYLQLMFIVSVLMYFVVKLSDVWYFIIMAGAFAITVPLNYFIRLYCLNNYIPFSVQVIPVALVCMMFGYWLKKVKYDGRIVRNQYLNAFLAVALGIFGFVLNLGSVATVNHPVDYQYIPAALMICHMIVNVTSGCYNKIICFMGRNSLYILGVHRVLLYILQERTGIEKWLLANRITGVIASFFISVFVISVICAAVLLFGFVKNKLINRKVKQTVI